jgi:hypothetical protein
MTIKKKLKLLESIHKIVNNHIEKDEITIQDVVIILTSTIISLSKYYPDDCEKHLELCISTLESHKDDLDANTKIKKFLKQKKKLSLDEVRYLTYFGKCLDKPT